MESIYLFDIRYLIPAAPVALIAAIVFLLLRRKKNGVGSKHAKGYLIAAISLFAFAAISMVAIPLIHFIYLVIKFGAAVFYSGFKSI